MRSENQGLRMLSRFLCFFTAILHKKNPTLNTKVVLEGDCTSPQKLRTVVVMSEERCT